jgi:alpha,alpha-trehalase
MSAQAAPAVGAGLRGPFEAVLFDMDGVITDTARAHAAAWQRLFDDYLKARADERGAAFRPFDIGRDYRLYVDGKPRYDGVRSFLHSRGIELPEGKEGDAPDAQTVCGLGNCKNRYFGAWLEQNRVQAYPGTLKLIAELRRAGVKTAAYSASRNAAAVLRSAGVLDLFDARVDGSDLVRLDLPGKPDPAMLREAASQLAVPPERCAVVEDAIAGVEAGAKGGFGLVIGVDRGDRGDYGDDLRRAGAQLVVRDLGEMVLAANGQLGVKTLANLPSVWKREDEIRRRLSGKEAAVFLDYDGTLTPIVEDHTKALLAQDMREAVHELSQRCKVAIVSGRDLAMLKHLVKLDSVFYAGSHGFEIAGPEGAAQSMERGVEFLPELDQVEQVLRERLAGIEGHAVERKRLSIAVHYRRVAAGDVGNLAGIVDRVLAEHPRLHKGGGKKVFELQPDIEWNKGHAVLWLLQQLGLDRPKIVPFYIGDDVTDEDAFRALAGRGVCVAVRDGGTRQTAADYALADVGEVQRFLGVLSAMVNGERGP